MGENTAAFLDWRYAGFKTRRYQLFCLTEKPTGALAGFVVFTALAGKVYVVDLFAADAGDTVDHLLMAFARGMGEAGHLSIYVSFVGRRSFGDRLKTLGYFRSGDQERSLVVYTEKGAPADLAADLRDPENWFMFDGEMDI